MKSRNAKLIVNHSGGTASKSGKTYRVNLPNCWMEELGLDENSRELNLSFDGEKVIIKPDKNFNSYLKPYKGHKLIRLDYYNFDVLQTTIAADYTEKKVRIKNHTDDIIHLAFGANKRPAWQAYQLFLEERCIPKKRAGLNEYLDTIGVDKYEPLEIIKKTKGRMAEDHQWIEVSEL